MRLIFLCLIFTQVAFAEVNLKGWDFIVEDLVKDGLDRELVIKTFSDKRMPARDVLTFNLNPRESRAQYRKHDTRANRANALKFYQEHKETFEKAAKLYNIDPSVVLAILQVETKCGLFTGNARVLHRLARLASAISEDAVRRNYERIKKEDKSVTIKDVRDRARWLYETFYPHVAASFYLAKELGTEPLELRGSFAGAVGLGQFLPGNYFVFGKDGDNDHLIDPLGPTDSIYSVASYLHAHGWGQEEDVRKVIKKYNNSEPYVDTVLAMAKKLKPKMKQG